MKHKPATDTAHLRTERPNPASRDLDTKSPLEIAEIINREDQKVAKTVKKALPQVAKAISAALLPLRCCRRQSPPRACP